MKNSHFAGSERGATLLFVIIAMVIMAIISVGLYSLSSTSTFNQVVAQRNINAFYIAESGIRIAVNEYQLAPTNATLLALNGRNVTFSNTNLGQFTTYIHPYWMYSTANYVAGASTLVLAIPGDVPLANLDGTAAISYPTVGRLKVKGKAPFARFSAAPAIAGKNLTFTLTTTFGFPISQNDELYFCFLPDGASQTVDNGGSFAVKGNPAMFPPENGNISISLPNVGIFNYQYRQRVPLVIPQGSTFTSVTLQGIISLPRAPVSDFPITVTNCDTGNDNALCHNDPENTTMVSLGKSVAIRSRGVFGQ